ncbi:cutinase family protein [Nocardia sp. CA2R105]|uniref:cutinase family protein n=1 Tax=Nocardia coffeae TaxID=2873381 RepID=UPI001CA786DB|nr:cutinase family protein [Nocardia coffeae]MBY8862046.1 cutinase family protein [Nocardia coffeae]
MGASCPALYVLAVQGPYENAGDTSSTTDTGALGALFSTLEATAGQDIQHAYLPYGRTGDGAAQPYDQAVNTAAEKLGSAAHELLGHCAHTRIAAVGDEQGAASVAEFARQVGARTGPIPAEAVAAVALFGNPQRPNGSPTFPGRPAQTRPDSVPGVSEPDIATITLNGSRTTGGGVSQSDSGVTPYGALTGRVVDLCTPGDLGCDTQAGSPIARTIANITAQSNLHDPISAISTVAQALAGTVWKTATSVITQDIQGNSLDQLSYRPTKPLGQRLAEASDPSTPMPGPDQALATLFKIGTIGLNAVVSIAQRVLTPATIAELATVGMTNPGAALADLGVKLAGAAAELVPPQTALGWLDQAFTAITSTLTDNTDLYNAATQAQYSDTSSHGESYRTAPATPQGTPAFDAVAHWLAVVAHDLAATTSPATPSATAPPEPSSSASTEPTTTATTPRASGEPTSHVLVPHPDSTSPVVTSPRPLRRRDFLASVRRNTVVPRRPSLPEGPNQPSHSRQRR